MIAIYNRVGSFSDRWITYCQDHDIPYTCIDLFSNTVISDIEDIKANAYLFHPPFMDIRAEIVAKQVIQALDLAGIKVFPGFKDYWHFDDKIAQAYLFQSLHIPTPQTHVFVDQEKARNWLKTANYPLVFKLRKGAGSSNVKLVHSYSNALALTKRMFSRGYPIGNNLFKDIGTKVYKHRQKKDFAASFRRLPVSLKRWLLARRTLPWERGYVYFQGYLPDNAWDTRVTVIGNRAFGFRRFIRPGDFRASGSGRIDYDPASIDQRCVELAFTCSRRLGTKCMAFDLVHDNNNNPVVIEMSYAFVANVVYKCPGHWNENNDWTPGHLYPQDAILLDMLS